MSRAYRVLCPLLLAAAVATGPARADDDPWELGVVAGLSGGGDVTASPFGQDDNLDTAFSYGLSLARAIRADAAIEATWLHREPSFTIDDPAAGSFEVRVDSLDVGGVYRPQRQRGGRPFVSAALGVMRYAADRSGFDDDLRVSFTVGGGVAWPLTPRTALRLTARGRLVFGDATLAGVCGGVGCLITLQADGDLQIEGDAAWLVRW